MKCENTLLEYYYWNRKLHKSLAIKFYNYAHMNRKYFASAKRMASPLHLQFAIGSAKPIQRNPGTIFLRQPMNTYAGQSLDTRLMC